MAAKKERAGFTFEGECFSWELGKLDSPLRWIYIHPTFGQLRDLGYIQVYDYRTGEGWQRAQDEAYCRKIAKDVEAGKFTPVGWVGGILGEHEKSLELYEEDGVPMARFTVTRAHKLPVIDGGHRRGGMEILRAAAERDGNAEEVERIDGQRISVQVFLDPTHLKKHFRNCQLGRPNDRNVGDLMDLMEGNVPEEIRPFAVMGLQVASSIVQNQRSHLCGQIRFPNGAAAKIDYYAANSKKKTDAGTTIFGGAKIATAMDKDAAWLEATYVEAWQALLAHAPHEQDHIPALLRAGSMLCPTTYGGTRGATMFLIGLGNMLAWWKAFKGVDKAPPEALKRFATTVDGLFNRPREECGWSGEEKRRHLKAFCQAFFADLARSDKEQAKLGRVGMYEGVPIPLVKILSPGAFKLDLSKVPLGVRPGQVKKAYDQISAGVDPYLAGVK